MPNHRNVAELPHPAAPHQEPARRTLLRRPDLEYAVGRGKKQYAWRMQLMLRLQLETAAVVWLLLRSTSSVRSQPAPWPSTAPRPLVPFACSLLRIERLPNGGTLACSEHGGGGRVLEPVSSPASLCPLRPTAICSMQMTQHRIGCCEASTPSLLHLCALMRRAVRRGLERREHRISRRQGGAPCCGTDRGGVDRRRKGGRDRDLACGESPHRG